MRSLPLKLGPGSDLRRSLEQLAREEGASGFVLGVVGNLARAAFQCPGRPAPTVLEGDLEIITLNGTVSPQGVHLHLSLSDGDCRVWGGHLEPGTLVLKGADLLVGFLPVAVAAPAASVSPAATAEPSRPEPRVEIAVASHCPWSARALRMLRTLGIPHQVGLIGSEAERQAVAQRSGRSTLPQLFIDGEGIGGYDALAELHGRGELAQLR
jgi:predicted DNA-binding protein with PD1-like motif/glutaredoxin